MGRPLALRAARKAEGPGITSIFIPAARARETRAYPGSEIPGVPASEASARCSPFLRRVTRKSAFSGLLYPCREISSFLGIASCLRRFPVTLVSSQTTASARVRTSIARRVMSPRLPIGVATIDNIGPADSVMAEDVLIPCLREKDRWGLRLSRAFPLYSDLFCAGCEVAGRK